MVDVRGFDADCSGDWDALISSSLHGARQNSRAFLNYHGDVFTDRSVTFVDKGQLVAVFPAALDPRDSKRVVSHPGAAYGGLVIAPGIPSSRVPHLTQLIQRHFADEGFESLIVRPVWPWLTERPDETFIHELIRLGAQAQPWQLASILPLGESPELSSRRRRMVRRAESMMSLRWGLEHLVAFWNVLEARLRDSHSASPVHSVRQVMDIADRSPGFVHLVTAWSQDDEMLAGAVIFAEAPYVHLQYMAATDAGKHQGAMDLVIASARTFGESRGARTLSLGSSVEPDSKSINPGLLDFKSEFGSATRTIPALHLLLV